MTTYISHGTATNGTAVGFRAWGQEFSNMLAAVGLVKTADTGQIDWATVLGPATSAAVQGYEIWRFNDSRQATAPIVIKIEYGGQQNNGLGVWITVGQSTDGAGNINSSAQSPRVSVSSTAGMPGGSRSREACFARGAFWIGFHDHHIAFAVIRSADPAGNITGDGCVIYVRNFAGAGGGGSSVSAGCLRFGSQAAFKGWTTWYAFSPYAMDSSALGVDKQLLPHYGWFPRVQNLHAVFSYITNDFATNTVAILDLGFGPTTFRALGQLWGVASNSSMASNTNLALIWE